MKEYNLVEMMNLDINDELDDNIISLMEDAQSDPQAMLTLANVYFYGYQSLKKNYDQAFKYYEKATQHGVPFSYYGLGICFYEGKGTPRDYQKAFEYFMQASDLGVIEARVFLAYLYEGHLIEADDYDALALYYYRDAANHHNEQGSYHLGYCYEFGLCGLDIDLNQALFWYKQAGDMNYPPALVALGQMYAKGVGVEVDFDQSIQYRKQAIELGNEVAMFDLALLFLYGPQEYQNIDEGIQLLHEANDLELQVATIELARLYLEGKLVIKDQDFALKLLEIKAMQNQIEIILYLAWLYATGTYFDVDLVQSLNYLQQGYRYYPARSSYYLGEYYRIYAPIIDEKKAFDYYLEASLNQDPRAYNLLGDYYFKGDVVSKNDATAFDYYQKAALLDNLNGIANVGMAYELGIGVSKDIDKAYEYLSEAAFSGHIIACLRLMELTKHHNQFSMSDEDRIDLLIYACRYVTSLKDLTRALKLLSEYMDWESYYAFVQELSKNQQSNYESIIGYQLATQTLTTEHSSLKQKRDAIDFLHQMNNHLSIELLSSVNVSSLNLGQETLELISKYANRSAFKELIKIHKNDKDYKRALYYKLKSIFKKPRKII